MLNKEDQRVLVNSILDRDLFISLQLIDDDDFMASVDKVKIVFTGLCNIFMKRVGFLKERKQPWKTNSALCRRLGYLGKLANIKEVSGNDLLMLRFTACCDDKALCRDIFKIKDLTWECLIKAINTHEATASLDTATLTRGKLFKMNISNAGSSGASTPTTSRTSATAPTHSPFVTPHLLEEASRKQKGPEWIQDRNRERTKLLDGIRKGSLLRKKDSRDRAPSQGPKNRDHVICHRCQCSGHYASECTAPAPNPRSGSREPQRDGDRGPRGTSSDRSRGASKDKSGSTGSSDRHRNNHIVRFDEDSLEDKEEESDLLKAKFFARPIFLFKSYAQTKWPKNQHKN